MIFHFRTISSRALIVDLLTNADEKSTHRSKCRRFDRSSNSVACNKNVAVHVGCNRISICSFLSYAFVILIPVRITIGQMVTFGAWLLKALWMKMNSSTSHERRTQMHTIIDRFVCVQRSSCNSCFPVGRHRFQIHGGCVKYRDAVNVCGRRRMSMYNVLVA